MNNALMAIVAAAILVLPAFADDDHRRGGDRDRDDHFHGAPGPIAGAGLPFLAVGFGVYWLVMRRRRKQ